MAKNPTEKKKFETVISKNTFFFYNQEFEEEYEGYLTSLRSTLLSLKNDIDSNRGFKKETLEKFLLDKKEALNAMLVITGISRETLKRLITVMRIVDDEELDKAVYRKKWSPSEDKHNLGEWSDKKIATMIETNKYFRKGLVNIFFDGASIGFLRKTLPLFELKKLESLKLKFEPEMMIDTLIRYKQKGSYAGKARNNAETVIKDILNSMEIPFCSGQDLAEFAKHHPNEKRTMDFIIPDNENPKIIIESSFLSATASQQGDKSKTEISIKSLIKKHYSKAIFIGFLDGIGWYVRKKDLKRMVSAYHDVFTFHQDELKRFEVLVKEKLCI